MSLVESALERPGRDRRAYIATACGADTELFDCVWGYVEREDRMRGFLLDPFCAPPISGSPFAPGDVLADRFRIVREIAQGGMGIVYEAVDQKLDRRVALKCAKGGFGKRLPPEARNATEISHPNVCRTFEIHTASTPQGDLDFVTMEFLEGETLAARLARGKLPRPEAIQIARELCAGVAEAHRKGVIHGDLKSNNVILLGDPSGTRPVITDFGLAHRMDSGSPAAARHSIGGTPDYMAPELWRGEKISVASDIYALGVILCELLAGCRPRPADPVSDERLGAPRIDRKWDRILARSLAADPAHRYATVDEMAGAIAPNKRRWLIAATATVLVGVASAAITYERASPPKQTVRLAVLPFEGSPDSRELVQNLTRDTAIALSRLKGTAQTRLIIIPPEIARAGMAGRAEEARVPGGATHSLRVDLARQDGAVAIRADLKDTSSDANTREWTARYQPSQLGYAPDAITGFVTNTFRLPIGPAHRMMNAAARESYETGLSYVQRNIHPDDSIALLEKAVSVDPDSPLGYAGLAEAQYFKYLLTLDPSWKEKAQESVRQAELRDLDLAEVHAISGLLKANSGHYEDAEADYLRAIELQPKSGDVYRRLSGIYNRHGQIDQALGAIKTAIQVQPDYFKNYQQLGALHLLRGNSDEAIAAFRKMVELSPALWESHFSLGAALSSSGRVAEAEGEVRAAIALEDSTRAEHELGLILQALGRNREAIGCFRKALSLGRETALLWLHLGLSYAREGRDGEAKQAFRRGLDAAEKSVARDPREGSERAPLAYLAARLGDSPRATSEIEQALRVARTDPETCVLAVLTYEVLGRRTEALGVLASSPSIVTQLSRYPELADFRQDPRFMQMASSKNPQ